MKPATRAPSILVADDEASARTIMRAALRRAGYDVHLATGGEDALAQFGQQPCDMVMLDMDMPDRSGLEVCAQLRQEVGPLLPIVMVTGMDDVDSVERAYQHGATDFIAKPVNWALIGHRVRYLFRAHEALMALRDAQARVSRLAYFDALTGLPNRNSFLERVDREIARARHDGKRLAVLFMDLDGFKGINDSLGHAAGDLILQWAAERLREGMRAKDLLLSHSAAVSSPFAHGDVKHELARLGGDEFTAVILDIEHPKDAMTVANRIAQSVRRPFVLEGRELRLTASIGIAMYPDDGSESVTLLKHADTAMYHAKTSGRDNAQLYNVSLSQDLVKRMELDAALRKAVEDEEFELLYQPQVDVRTGRVSAVEALLRWAHPQRGGLSPLEFLPLSEEIGLIERIGHWVLRTACQAAAQWGAHGHPVRVAVNLSAVQLRSPQFVQHLRAVLASSGLPAEQLELEVPEGLLAEGVVAPEATLSELRGLGVQLAVDDFGNGYCPLARLARMPMHHVKVDRRHVNAMHQGPAQTATVKAMVAVARSLELRCTASGVESADQLHSLQALGCDSLQGFYFSRPVPAAQMLPLLQRQWPIAPVLQALTGPEPKLAQAAQAVQSA